MAFTCSRCKTEDKSIEVPHKLLKFCDECKGLAKVERRANRRKKKKTAVKETVSA